MNSINVLYFDKKSIQTVDFSYLFKTIFDYFPDAEVTFSEMSHNQKSLVSENEFGITCIRSVLMIFDGDKRREDIENQVIRFGLK